MAEPVLEVRHLRKVYGRPGPIRAALLASREFAEKVVERGGRGFDPRAARERLVPLSSAARHAIDTWLAHLKAQADGRDLPAGQYLFASRGEEGHLTRQHFALVLKRLARDAGLPAAKVSPAPSFSFSISSLKGVPCSPEGMVMVTTLVALAKRQQASNCRKYSSPVAVILTA